MRASFDKELKEGIQAARREERAKIKKKLEERVAKILASDVTRRLADVGVRIEPSNADRDTTPRAVLDRRGFDICNFDAKPFEKLLNEFAPRMQAEVDSYRAAQLAQSTLSSRSGKGGSGKQEKSKRRQNRKRKTLSPSGGLVPIFNFDDKRWGHSMFSDLKDDYKHLKRAIVKKLEDHWGIKGGNKHETILFTEEDAELQAPHADYERIFKMLHECKRLSYSVFIGVEPREVWRVFCYFVSH
jgi:hypothetical protein